MDSHHDSDEAGMTRSKMVELLNEDLSREYHAVIAYVVYSQTMKGAQYMNIASELEAHAQEELQHAIMLAQQIDYLGGTPSVSVEPVKVSMDPEEMLRFDLEDERVTIEHYRRRIRQAEALGEFGLSEVLRKIILQEQEHEIDLADALGIPVHEVEAVSHVPAPGS
jgi:bacterioferritin